MDPMNRSTSSLNDPMPGTAAADASQAALRDEAVRADDVSRAAGARHADDNPGDEIGEAVGGISGVLTGAALGSLGGPIGTVIGGIAGAVSGWWAGRAISEAASHATDEDDAYYRGEYERVIERRVDGAADVPAGGASASTSSTAGVGPAAARGYDGVRPAYQLGHLAGRNPDYHGRGFDEVEPELRHGWTDAVSRDHGDWDSVRPHVRAAYERSQATYVGSGASAGTQITGGLSALAAGATYAAGRSGFGDGRPAGDAGAGGDPSDRARRAGPAA
jgi:hypothetical protein